jgi:predicted NAD/FAD-binding protein
VQILKNTNIKSITRSNNKISLILDEKNYEFDKVVFSNHPEEILKMLKDPTEKEQNILTKFRQTENIAYTHNDIRFMPNLKKCWASWNFKYAENIQEGSITYWMNKLQKIDENFPLFVTLNPIFPIDHSKIFDKFTFYHPIYDMNSFVGQQKSLNYKEKIIYIIVEHILKMVFMKMVFLALWIL